MNFNQLKGRGAKTFKKWLDELVGLCHIVQLPRLEFHMLVLTNGQVRMKAVLQPYVENQFQSTETGSIIKLIPEKTPEYLNSL